MVRHRVAVGIAVVVAHVLVAALSGRLGAPIQGDERDYLAGAARLWDGGAYPWGYRPPLVSLVFAPAALLDGEAALRAARLISLVFGASSVAWWLRAAARTPHTPRPEVVSPPRPEVVSPPRPEVPRPPRPEVVRPPRPEVVAPARTPRPEVFALTALLTAIWPPFLAFSSLALAEGLALFLVSGLMTTSLLLVEADGGVAHRRRAVGVGVLLALAVLTKANLGLLAVAWAGWVVGLKSLRWRTRVATVTFAAATAALLYSPWGAFQLSANGTLSPTTSGGMNLAVGSGAYGFGMDTESESIVARYRAHAGWDTSECRGPAELCARIVAAAHPGEVHAEAGALARAHWRAYPAESVAFALVKCAHTLGLSLRGPADWLLVAFGVVGLVASVVAWRRRERAVVGLLVAAYATAFVTSAAFLPNIRLRTPVVDPANLLVMAVAMTVWRAGRGNRR